MRSRTAISTVCLAALLCGVSTPVAAQITAQGAGASSGYEDWGWTFETGVFWGQLFGGLSSANDKTTFKKVRAEIWRNTKRLTMGGKKSWQGPTPRATAPARSEGGTLQLGGGIGISNFGFPKEAVDFFGESGFTVTTIMGGARYVLPPQPRFAAFVQGQAGIEHAFEENAFAIAPEGGVIVPLNKNLLLTVTAGIRTAFFEDASDTAFELGVGFTFPFGHK